MNTNIIKAIVFSISLVFMLVLLIGVFLNKYDDKLLDTQVDVAHNLSLSKDLTLKLNNSFRTVSINYDELLKANKILKNDINQIVTKNPEKSLILKLKNIIYEQDNDIDLIKRANSIITNSLQFLKYYHVSNPLKFTKSTQELLDLSYEIKLSDYSLIEKYSETIKVFELQKVNNLELNTYQKSVLMHAKMILKNAQLVKSSLESFNNHQKELSHIYLKIRNSISDEHLSIKTKMQIIQMILVILLFIFVFLILKFFRLEKLHKNEEEKLQNIIDKNVIMSIIDLNGITKTVSSAHLNISGYKEEELINKPNFMMTYSTRAKEINDTLKSGKIWTGEICDTTKNGEEYWVSSVIEPIFDENNEMKYYLGIRRDITNTVNLEELTKNQEAIIKSQTEIANTQRDKAIKASASKSEFLANMSHEIRTPLNSIKGFIELLKEDETNVEKKEYLNIINSSSQNLIEIVNDILDFSKIESGQFTIDKITFDPRKEFEIIIKTFQAKVKEKNIDLVISLFSLPQALIGDLLRINQVLNNLLSNALKFTSQNKKIYLSVKYENENLSVAVKDEGIGISHEYQKRIFESFTQEDNSTTRKYGGTGLGLSISYNLAKLMDGELKVQSKEEVGSTFTFSLPLEETTILQTNKIITDKISYCGHILLVEDNKANQVFMKVILKKANLTFDIAHDGIEAIEMFKKHSYDLILMDENMPNMSGIEATKEILKIENSNNLAHTPVIALTANALVDDRSRFLDAGMDEYLSKPLDKNKLYKILEKFSLIESS